MTRVWRKFDIFWNECLDLFSQVEEMPMANFIQSLVIIIKNHQETIENLLTEVHKDKKYLFEDDEKNELRFITTVDVRNFVIGSAKHNYKEMVHQYQQYPPKSRIEAWRNISNFIWKSILFVSQEVCPQCKSDHLCILTDSDESKIYKSCPSCFYTKSEDHQSEKQGCLVPASLKLLTHKGFDITLLE